MRLVGASNTYIRGPFLVEGMVYGVLSSLITMLIFWPVSAWLGTRMSDFFGMNIFDYYTSNFFQILLILIATGVVLGSISSGLAIRRYLRK
jgi:cell division transport system permease protein